jgi:hypothetical protein
VAAGNKLRAGQQQTCLFQSSITRMVSLYLPHTVPARGRHRRTQTRITCTSLKCGPDYCRRHWHCRSPARPAPNEKRNGDSGVTPPGPRTTATTMTLGNKSSAGPPHSQLRRVRLAGINAGFNFSSPPPLGGTVPNPPVASEESMLSMPLP